jgi:hypothetical protein
MTPLGGLGEGDFYFVGSNPEKDPGGKFQLHFGKGNREVILSVVTDGKLKIGAAQKLAKIAYSRPR